MMLEDWVKFEGKLTNKHKKFIKIFIFITLATIPFISAASLMTMEQFIDSFENPDHYISIQNNNIIESTSSQGHYIIIQKSTYPNFEINENDEIIYFDNNGEIKYSTIIHTSKIGRIKQYYALNENEIDTESIYENQIIGKVIINIENNLWNTISIKTWDIAIHQLNINNLIK